MAARFELVVWNPDVFVIAADGRRFEMQREPRWRIDTAGLRSARVAGTNTALTMHRV